MHLTPLAPRSTATPRRRTVLLTANSVAAEQANHAGASKKTEHYTRWEYSLHERQLYGSIKAHFIHRCDQVADCLTKVLDK
eukprot:6204421-Pleurochrysis_carterae.AAC.5